jgi:hypothetical protein
MTKYHVCVWIDHAHARLFELGARDVTAAHLEDNGPVHHIHRKADHVGLGSVPARTEFLAEIAGRLDGARAILILGPGRARNELAGYLNDRDPKLAKAIWGIEASDHPTDAQIIAQARRFFEAADRMHAT